MINTDKYEGLIDAEGYIDYDGLDHLLAEVKRLREEKKRLHRLFGLAVHHIDALKEIVT